MIWAQALAENNWQFWSLVVMVAAGLVKQWLDHQTMIVNAEANKLAAEHAATAAVNAGVAAQNAAIAAAQASVKTDIMANKQDAQHLATNSRLSELLRTTEVAAHAAGVLIGIKSEQDRSAAAAAAAAAPTDHQFGPGERLEEMRGD